MTDADRLDSWKEIASYLRRSLRTAQRWERDAGLPVRRVGGDGGAVYAFLSDLDAWWQRRSLNGDGPASQAVATANGRGAVRADPALPAARPRVRSFLSHDLRVNPDSAPGHADLAVYFFTLTMVGLMPPDEGLPAARGAAGRALELDPDRAEAQAMLAVVAALYDCNWVEAERRWCLAFAREPVPAMVRFHYSPFFLEPLGRYAESLANLEPALAAEPLYLLGRVERATALCAVGRVDEGLAEFELVCRVDPHFAPAVGYLAREYAIAGRLDDARTFAERAYAAVPHHPNAVGMLAGILERTGDRDRADRSSKHTAASAPGACRAPAPKLPWPATGSMSRWIAWRMPLPNAIPASGSCSQAAPSPAARHAPLAGGAGGVEPPPSHSSAAADFSTPRTR